MNFSASSVKWSESQCCVLANKISFSREILFRQWWGVHHTRKFENEVKVKTKNLWSISMCTFVLLSGLVLETFFKILFFKSLTHIQKCSAFGGFSKSSRDIFQFQYLFENYWFHFVKKCIWRCHWWYFFLNFCGFYLHRTIYTLKSNSWSTSAAMAV